MFAITSSISLLDNNLTTQPLSQRSMKSLTLLTTALGLAAASPISLPRSTECSMVNTDLCSRKYSNVSYIGTHDSAFVGGLNDPTCNQEIGVTGQLDAGIRMLQSQTHKDAFGTLSMCHTSCWLKYAGSVADYLSTVKSWLDANPSALVTLLLANGDNVDISEFDSAFKSSGLKPYCFVPSTSPSPLAKDDWPTLGSMISSGQRLVTFLDYGADESSVPYILDQYKYFFDTPYDGTDPSFNQCTLAHPPGASPDGRMYIVNHFLDKKLMDGVLVPDNGADFQTNAATGQGSIGDQVGICEGLYGRRPNFVMLDMFNRGDWLEAQQAMN